MDTKADINSNSFKLSANGHPNVSLQKLWNEHGEEKFEITVLEVLPYDEKNEKQDYAMDLEQLLIICLNKVEGTRRLKR